MNIDIPKIYDEIKTYNAWNVAQSNPCFEIWLYYHFYDNVPSDEDVEKYATFKEYVDSLISGGFNFEKDPVRLEDAILNAENNHSVDKDGKPEIYTTEVYFLGKEIDSFVKSDLMKLLNKLK